MLWIQLTYHNQTQDCQYDQDFKYFTKEIHFLQFTCSQWSHQSRWLAKELDGLLSYLLARRLFVSLSGAVQKPATAYTQKTFRGAKALNDSSFHGLPITSEHNANTEVAAYLSTVDTSSVEGKTELGSLARAFGATQCHLVDKIGTCGIREETEKGDFGYKLKSAQTNFTEM